MIYTLQICTVFSPVCWVSKDEAAFIRAVWALYPDAPQFKDGAALCFGLARYVLHKNHHWSFVFCNGDEAKLFLQKPDFWRSIAPPKARALLWRRLQQHGEELDGVPLPVTVKIGPPA